MPSRRGCSTRRDARRTCASTACARHFNRCAMPLPHPSRPIALTLYPHCAGVLRDTPGVAPGVRGERDEYHGLSTSRGRWIAAMCVRLDPDIQPRIFKRHDPQIDPRILTCLYPHNDPRILTYLYPHIDPRILTCLYPHIDPRMFPHVTQSHLITRVMHLPDTLYWVFNDLIVRQKLLTFEELNQCIREAPAYLWEDGIRPPPFHRSLLKRLKNGDLKKGGRTRFTAHHCKKIALARHASFPASFHASFHASSCINFSPRNEPENCSCYGSIELYSKFIPEPEKNDVWCAWVKHIKYLRLLFSPSITEQEISKLDVLITEAQMVCFICLRRASRRA